MSSIRNDGINPALLGMSGVCSEDSVRRGLIGMDEIASEEWLKGSLKASYEPRLTAFTHGAKYGISELYRRRLSSEMNPF